MTVIWPAGYPLFTTAPDDDDGVLLARRFIADIALTSEDVKLVKRDGCVMVIKRRDIINGR